VWVKRLKNEKYLPKFITPRLQGGGGSAAILGCFSYAGTSVSKINTGRINQYLYIDTLEEFLLPSAQLLIGKNNIRQKCQKRSSRPSAFGCYGKFGEGWHL